ncbi:hypothetical protein F4777DRAFT_577978 [Nemania sp. FL0916]|nr:hypothetical protein F4777DRAFT_577978 [Nemania sp. FL0916]
MDFVYAEGTPSGVEAREVLNQGWRWVNTNTINATQLGAQPVALNGKPDRLGKYFHHSQSTHRIVRGDLQIKQHKTDANDHRDHRTYELGTYDGYTKQDRVEPETRYSATSKYGCQFVEGQQCLSPESAERFINRGTLKAVNKRRGRTEFPSSDAMRTWLLQVKFDPKGKARPNWLRGEKPILDISGVNPPLPADVQDDLLKWFENEWQRPRQHSLVRNSTQIVYAILAILMLWHLLGKTFIFRN